MKRFFEFYQQISQEKLLREDLGLNAPSSNMNVANAGGMMQMGQNAGGGEPSTNIKFDKPHVDTGTMRGDVENEDYKRFVKELEEMMKIGRAHV